jgi:hypothetical protein
MTYKQWISVTVRPIGLNLIIKDVNLPWGKFYQYPNKDVEVPIEHIRNLVIENKKSAVISARGASDGPSGTEGQFNIYDNTNPANPVYIGQYKFDCPWGDNMNTSVYTPGDPSSEVYMVPLQKSQNKHVKYE